MASRNRGRRSNSPHLLHEPVGGPPVHRDPAKPAKNQPKGGRTARACRPREPEADENAATPPRSQFEVWGAPDHHQSGLVGKGARDPPARRRSTTWPRCATATRRGAGSRHRSGAMGRRPSASPAPCLRLRQSLRRPDVGPLIRGRVERQDEVATAHQVQIPGDDREGASARRQVEHGRLDRVDAGEREPPDRAHRLPGVLATTLPSPGGSPDPPGPASSNSS